MFPNQFDVYLHDTPKDQLFERRDRNLSHGCVRVEKSGDLAEFVFGGTWTRDQIVAAMDSGETKQVELQEPLPVYILYSTSWVDADGTIEFRPDVYGYDAGIAQELAAR